MAARRQAGVGPANGACEGRLDIKRRQHQVIRLDPAFGATLGPTAASAARTNVLKLEGDPVAQRFAELQQTLGRDQPMTKAFAAVERLVPLLRANRPDLIPRLAKVVYWAVQRFIDKKREAEAQRRDHRTNTAGDATNRIADLAS